MWNVEPLRNSRINRLMEVRSLLLRYWPDTTDSRAPVRSLSNSCDGRFYCGHRDALATLQDAVGRDRGISYIGLPYYPLSSQVLSGDSCRTGSPEWIEDELPRL